MARYPQQHLEISQLQMAVLAIDMIGHLPISSKGNRWALKAICLHVSYVFVVPIMEKSAENVIQAYLSGILSHKGLSVAILSDNGTEFKNKVLNEVCDQLGIKGCSLSCFMPKIMQKWRTFIISLNGHSPNS